MNLGELKKALTRFPNDMDESEVLLSYMTDGKQGFDNLAFVAYAEVRDITCLVIGTQAVAIDKIKKGTLHFADGRNVKDEGFDVNDEG